MRKRFVLLCAMCVSVLFVSDRSVVAGDPSTLPLLQFADLAYAGGFRLPRNTHAGEGYSFGGLLVAHNPSRNSLFVSNRAGKLSEVTIPTPVNTANPDAMPFAAYLQDFADPTEGHMQQIASSGADIDGLLVVGDRLYGTGAIYYDAQNTQTVSHYSRSTNLSTSSFIGMSQVWEAAKSGFVSGYLAAVPPEWQSLLGGPAITGQCCIPVVWRTSWGPAAFAWNPADIGRVNPVSARPLLYYPSEHQTLGPWLGSNPTYGGNVQMGGLAIIAGTRTALYIGRNAMGAFCYGNGTGNLSEVGKPGPDGTAYCYDPTNPHKGPHGYPYRYQMWAYDLNEFVKVNAGLKQPWEVVPYGVWPFDFPTPEPGTHVGGVGYDANRQTLYVSQMFADHDGYEDRPVIHTLKVNAPASAPPAPSAPPPPPSPAPSLTATAVTIVANRPAPQPTGTAVTFTAAPTGGVTPHQYKWWVYNGVAWSAVSGWETSQSFTWTPPTANPLLRFGVWVRSFGNAADALEATTWVDFPVTGDSPAPPPTAPGAGTVSAVGILPNRVAPQQAGTTTTWTATATGGAPQQFKWWVHDGLTWAAVTGWTTNATFAWTPSAANPNFKIGVWAKGAGNTTNVRDASAEQPFAITSVPAPAPSPAPPPLTVTPPPGGTTVTSLLLSSNKVAPQPRGSTMVFTAEAGGGIAPYEYKWFIFNGYGWLSPAGWTTSNTFTWSPGDTNRLYKIGLWVRSAGNTADAREFSAELPFPTVEPTSTAPITNAPASKVSSVALTPDRTGTGPGVTVSFTATPSGGVAPHQYKWFVYDDAWRAVTGWTASSQFAWTPTLTNPNYRVGVWVRSAGATADALEASREYAYPIRGGS